ncbi:MAG TPA: putative zinc-binding metallopeptidase [Gemmatimonadaceae bacterium]|nr:putative zinc-binding metallopeptidase [Gemmatimonadaceae bacterium]
MNESFETWEGERRNLMARKISELGLAIAGTRVEKMIDQLYSELAEKSLSFRPPVYLTDQWGCPDGTPLIGVPFYLADPRLEKIEDDFAEGIESENESMRFMRHEAGHAFNYAYRIYDRPDWRQTFGPYSRPYRERYKADPFSHDFVRHILGWYAQKHPDEDFAETFAVWLTPGLDWKKAYNGWPAMAKLEYVDRVMRELASEAPPVPALTDDDLPVEAMRYSLEEHYRDIADSIPISDSGIFDGDLRNIFATAEESPNGQRAGEFLSSHRREIVGRISYWTGEGAHSVREFLNLLRNRAELLDLRVRGLEASTLIELTAFGTAVMMNYRNSKTVSSRTRNK